nr:structural maintenance of chromosomes protein 1 [Tanacetum cinerariifolium]
KHVSEFTAKLVATLKYATSTEQTSSVIVNKGDHVGNHIEQKPYRKDKSVVADDMSGDYVSGMDVDVNVSRPFAMAQAAYDGLQLEDQILKFRDVKDAYLSQAAVRCLFPGVHGPMTKLCRPTQKKYNLGVTVAMGRFMDDVVDNE